MILRSIILAGAAAVLAIGPAWAQGTITENINNTGIPRNAPALGLSNIYGLNPCSSGSSVGVTTPLFGIGGAVSTIDKECETRNNAAVVITGLKDESLAREILCEIKDVRDAAIRLGKPCLRDQSAPKVASVVPGSATQPEVPIAAAMPVAPIARAVAAKPAVVSARPDAPAFCRVKDLDISLYPDCGVAPAPASFIGPSGPVTPATRKAQTPSATKRPGPSEAGVAVATSDKRPTWSPQHVEQASWRPPSLKIPAATAPEVPLIAAPRPQVGCAPNPDAQSGNRCQNIANAVLTLEQILVERRKAIVATSEKSGDGTIRASAQALLASLVTLPTSGAAIASASPGHR